MHYVIRAIRIHIYETFFTHRSAPGHIFGVFYRIIGYLLFCGECGACGNTRLPVYIRFDFKKSKNPAVGITSRGVYVYFKSDFLPRRWNGFIHAMGI